MVVTNCSNNYGPYQFPEKLIPLMILKALAGESLPVYGRGENVRDWLFVEDHARALVPSWRRDAGETYIIGGELRASEHRRRTQICALLDELRPDPRGPHARLIEFITDRPGHDYRYAIDASKIRRDLGWSPRESFDSGIRKTVEWYLANPGWTGRVMSGAYRGERLGTATPSLIAGHRGHHPRATTATSISVRISGRAHGPAILSAWPLRRQLTSLDGRAFAMLLTARVLWDEAPRASGGYGSTDGSLVAASISASIVSTALSVNSALRARSTFG